jgi:hypothetical protein
MLRNDFSMFMKTKKAPGSPDPKAKPEVPIMVTAECKEMLDYYVKYWMDLNKHKNYSEIIMSFKEEELNSRVQFLIDVNEGEFGGK